MHAATAEALASSPHEHLRQLVVTVSEGEVILTGRVPSYYLKQMAQEAVRPTLGRRRLLNRIEVCTGAIEVGGGGSPPVPVPGGHHSACVPPGQEPEKKPPAAPRPAAELIDLEGQFPPPTEAEIAADCRWIEDHWSTELLAPYRGTHVAVYNGAVVGSADDSLQLEIDLARRFQVHPQRFVIEYIPPGAES